MNWIDWLNTREAVPTVAHEGRRVAATLATIGTWDTATQLIYLPPGYTNLPNSGPQIIIRPKIQVVNVPTGWSIGKPPPPPPLDPSTSNLVMLHNQFRASHGLAPLVVDPRLMQCAADFAAELENRGVLSHFGSNGSTPWDRMVRAGYMWSQASENIAQGQTSDEEVMEDWESSPGHRADILGPYQNIGTGRSGNWWVVDFASPK